jgi:hypothetical protein
MSVRPSYSRVTRGALALMLLACMILPSGWLLVPVSAQGKEPSPIEVELIAPEQAGPGTVAEILIRYDAVDLNAGADLNYNVFGPGHVLTRDPEPPNPAYNTWIPTPETAQGTIKIRIQVHEGTDGQTILHQVEVRWGSKAAKYEARTLVKPLPPTPTPTPRPRPLQPTAVPAPTPTQPTESVLPEITLRAVSLVDLEGQPLSAAEINQEIAIEATYVSSDDARDVTIEVRFEPDVVNLNLPRAGAGYVQVFSLLPAAPNGGPLFEPALIGRIRPLEGGGDVYALQAFVRIVPSQEPAGDEAQGLESAPIEVHQSLSLRLSASTEAEIVRAGGNLIVHALVENPGSMPVDQVRLTLSELPDGFVVSPSEQAIEQVPANGGTERRVFTVRSPEDYEGQLDLYVIATRGGVDELRPLVLESETLTVRIGAAMPLRLATSASATAVYAGDAVYVDVSATNDSQFEASGVTAKLIDVSGNLGVLVQDVGDIGPGESREWVFVVQVPDDFPADTTATLVVQTISEDGITSQSSEIELAVACRPRLEVLVEPPAGRLRGGDSVEAIALIKNVSQCAARDVSVSLVGLPEPFVQPPAQGILELAPGEARYATFNVLIPQGYRGDASLIGEASTAQGARGQSPPMRIAVGGPSPALTVAFGLLILVVAAAGVVGAVLYFRKR